MAARTPRRSFANPFVVTLAVAPAACYVGTQNPPRPVQDPQTAQTPPPSDPQTPPPAQQTPQQQPPIITNPPRPTQNPPQVAQDNTWTIMKNGNDCQAVEKMAACPQGAMCNPPPPIKYACPENVTPPVTVVTHDGGATCAIEWDAKVSCPQGAVCNPPRPRAVACPKR